MTGVFDVVLGQILLMFLYLIIGYVLYRTGLITQEGSRALAHLLLYCVLPCVVLKSFCIEYSAKGAVELAVSIAAGAGVLLLSMAVSWLFFRKDPMAQIGTVLVIVNAAPIGSNIAVYAQRLGLDSSYAVQMVCLSTLLSLITLPVLLVQPAVFHRQTHAVQQDAVQGFGIRGQILKSLLLKKSLWNAVEGEQLSGLSVKVVKGHVAFSTFCSSLCSKIDRLSFENKKRTLFLLKSGALCNIMAV